jgi:hypothetical protein
MQDVRHVFHRKRRTGHGQESLASSRWMSRGATVQVRDIANVYDTGDPHPIAGPLIGHSDSLQAGRAGM